MNRTEKIQQTWATHTSSATAKQWTSVGVGAVKYMSAFKCDDIKDCIKQRNALQADFVNGTRLHIPVSFINEGLHGGAPGGTIFPMPVGLGATWDVELVNEIMSVVGQEAAAIGVDVVFAPVVNMMTDPRFGRLQEGYSSNPLLTSHLAVAAVKGLQGCRQNATAAQCGPQAYLNASGVAALGKHYAAYGASVGGLNGGPAGVSNRTLHDIFLRPWRAMAQAGLRACMPSHNTVLDVPAHASKWLIDDVLRSNFGFEGVALSDCNDIGVIYDFRMATNRTDAAALALKAGVTWDLQCGTDPANWGFNKLDQAFDAGLLDEATLDETVRTVLTLKFANGLFDQRVRVPQDVIDKVDSFLDKSSHRALAKRAALESMVLLLNAGDSTIPGCPGFVLHTNVVIGAKAYETMAASTTAGCCQLCLARPSCAAWTFESSRGRCFLKNETEAHASGPDPRSGAISGIRAAAKAPVLPFETLPKKIALIGPTASACESSVLGAYSLPGANVTCLDTALRAAGVVVTTCGMIDKSAPTTSESALSAKDKAAIADAVAAVGDPATEAAIVILGDLDGKVCGEWGDRDDLTLSGAQLPLLKAVVAAAEARNNATMTSDSSHPQFPVIVVLTHGRPQTFGRAADGGGEVLLGKLSALIAAWRPGEEFGPALVDLLQGTASPSGKLSHSWPRTVGHVHSGSTPWLQRVRGKWISNRKGALDTDGRRYDAYTVSNFDPTPLFRFGFGLSYTTFELQALQVSAVESGSKVLWEVEVDALNTGARDGAVIVQIYVQDPRGLPFVPYWKRLVAFKRVVLRAGAKTRVQIQVLRDDVAMYDSTTTGELALTLFKGTYSLFAATDSEDQTVGMNVTVV